ncbi:MAG TPA: hypothetical protein VIG26_05125 [Methyloceanibacter sp.]
MIRIHHFAPGEDVADEAALEQFQKQWATYQKLVDNNSLASKQTGDLLHAALTGLIKPFAFVDIACGDAGQMKQALAGTKINHYHGIDLSEPALELAAKKRAVCDRTRPDRFRRSFGEACRTRRRRLVRPLHPSSQHGG